MQRVSRGEDVAAVRAGPLAAPKLGKVRVLAGNVSWTGSWEPACLRGFEVCWTSPHSDKDSCEMVPPDATSAAVDGFQPCATLEVQVTALARGNNYTSDVLYGYGEAGPPEVTGLKATQHSRHMTLLEWSPLGNYSCVEHVRLWVCENRTQDRSTCLYAQLSKNMDQFAVYELRLCRYYYAFASTEEDYEEPRMATLKLYLDSANELTRVDAVNVTRDSAVVKWWISDVNLTCRTEKMRICYQEKGNETSPECWSWAMGQTGPSDSLALTDLYACTTYSAVVSLRTAGRYSHQAVTFTTPLHGDVIDAQVANVSDTAAIVNWSFDADRTDCRPDSMQVCYSPVGDSDSRICRSLGTAAHSSVHLRNLVVCRSYRVELTLLTTASPKPTMTLRLATLSKGRPVLQYINATSANASVRVKWIPVDGSVQCVRLYNVSWYSSGDPRRTWQSLPTDTTSYTIHAVSKGQTYYVRVSAVFVDNTTESLFQHVDVPAQSRSSTPFKKTHPLTILLISLICYSW
ncbi:uncharacterized protein LOC134536878 isoform X1 [Bacillus rossius redtenbacheri]|uniref:uncharacterized protein LOC134536878 isoform X1 n=1 Tax=Bacillus rossius redtenbacheri TaxID=93214 RepID=UPI002FDE7330